MSGDPASAPRKAPAPGEPFNPREISGSFGFGIFIPEKIAASTALSPTTKNCYGHLLRRAGKNNRCWPSHRDIAKHIGVGRRQVMRSLKELVGAELIRPITRTDASGRQTSNEYEFIWGPILQGEGDTSDTLPGAKSDRGTVTRATPTMVSGMTPLEVKKINHHLGRNKQRSVGQVASTVQDYSVPESDHLSSQKVDDAEPVSAEYASGKEELKAIYLAKTGVHFSVVDLDAIEVMLFCAGVTWEVFVADVRRHSWDKIKNPVGFLKNRAKKFRALTQVSRAPVTAAQAAEKDYRCPVCASTVRGEGAVIGADGKWWACRCASPEWVARQRARGVLAEEAIE